MTCNPIEIDTSQKFDNPNSEDITFEQLMKFIKNFEFIESQKEHPVKTCVYCSFLLHNQAESNGIKTAIVVIPEINHVITLFHTTDRGNIYIDATRFNLVIVEKRDSEFLVIRNNQIQYLGDEKHFHVFW